MRSLKYLIVAFVSLPLALVSPTSAAAVEDFRSAIKSIVPHLVIVRQRQPAKQPAKSKKAPAEPSAKESGEQASPTSADAAILELLRTRREAENFQHAFRVADELIATIHSTANFESLKNGETNWELLTRDGRWHEVSLAAYDKVSRLVILRASKELLDKIASESPVEESVPVGHWIDGLLEMGLPCVVVWYQEGAPRAKATMIAATGNAMRLGLAVLDFRFAASQVGAPVLDADGRLLGLVAMERSRPRSPELDRRFELRESPLQSERRAASESESPLSDDDQARPATVYISSVIHEPEAGAELIVPVNILNRLLRDVENSNQMVVLDFGMIGVRLGNGDATIRRVISGGAAAEKDCQAGDRILSIDGQKVRNDGDIFRLVSTYRAGDTLLLEIESAEKHNNPEQPENSATDASADTDANRDAAVRRLEITMRGIRTRSKSRADAEPKHSGQSSWLNSPSPLREASLVGVVREGQAKSTSADEARLREDIIRVRAEIEALMKELGKQEK